MHFASLLATTDDWGFNGHPVTWLGYALFALVALVAIYREWKRQNSEDRSGLISEMHITIEVMKTRLLVVENDLIESKQLAVRLKAELDGLRSIGISPEMGRQLLNNQKSLLLNQKAILGTQKVLITFLKRVPGNGLHELGDMENFKNGETE